jgi:DNA-binding transcriptional ArsR family regulator
VIQLVLRHSDVALIRFTHSPIHELVGSIMTLNDRRRHLMHRRWIAWAEPRVCRQSLELLTAVTPHGKYIPDFITPILDTPIHDPRPADLDEAMDRIVATDPARIRDELDHMVEMNEHLSALPLAAKDLYEDPERYVPRLIDEMLVYWRLVVEPVWDRVFALCADDVGYRMQQVADGGIERVLNTVSSQVSYHDDVITVDKRYECRHDLTGSGLMMMPCAFAWPNTTVACCHSDRACITYPPRGLGLAWEDRDDSTSDALGALVGRTRALMLDALALPLTTTHLAEKLGLSAAAVSQHLQVLKAAALVTSRRHGRLVLYQRTGAATVLIEASRSRRLAESGG